MVSFAQWTASGLLNEGEADLLQGDNVTGPILVLQYIQCVGDLMLDQIHYHGLFQVLPLLWFRHSVHHAVMDDRGR